MGWQVSPPTTQLAVLPGLSVPTTVVQAGTPAGGISPRTVSFTNPVTVNNSVIVAAIVGSASAVSVTPASGPDTFTLDANVAIGSSLTGQFFHVSNSAGGYSSVTATLAATDIEVFAWEVPGAVVFDSDAVSGAGSGTFTVNFTPGHPAEFLVGLSGVIASASLTVTPAAPWITQIASSGAGGTAAGSRQFVSTTSVVTYSGTWSSAASNGAAIAGYRLTNPGGTVPANECILYYFGGTLYALGPSGNPVALATT